mmetsp:Transcript_9023/g.16771  ORF Transcript_9023/g.16771 Transcript_9023/m.16771 type:complete len:895 (-) Transcript_9023:184-2868(-)
MANHCRLPTSAPRGTPPAPKLPPSRGGGGGECDDEDEDEGGSATGIETETETETETEAETETEIATGTEIDEPNELLRLIRARDWSLALDRASSHPEEARREDSVSSSSSPFSRDGEETKTTALAEALALSGRANTTLSSRRYHLGLIEALVRANPHCLMSWRHPKWGTLIHLAVENSAGTEVLHFLARTAAEIERGEGRARGERNRTTTLFACADGRGHAVLHRLCVRAARDAHVLAYGRGAGRTMSFSGSNKAGREEWKRMLEVVRIAAEACPPESIASALRLVLACDFRRRGGEGEEEEERPTRMRRMGREEDEEEDAESEVGGGGGRGRDDRALDLARLLLTVRPEAAADLIPPDCLSAAATSASATAAESENNSSKQRWRSGRPSRSRRRPIWPMPKFPNPVFLALANRHSPDVVQLLLSSIRRRAPVAARDAIVRCVVTAEGESPLHLAITLRRQTRMIETLLENGGSDTAGWEDDGGMTPLCWLWARHVLDRPFRTAFEEGTTWTGGGHRPLPVRTPMRRNLPSDYALLQDEAAKEVEVATAAGGRGRCRDEGEEMGHVKGGEDSMGLAALWEKAELLLPHAASACWNESRLYSNDEEQRKQTHPTSARGDGTDEAHERTPAPGEEDGTDGKKDDDEGEGSVPSSWPVVHAASYVPCPRPVLLLALNRRPSQLNQMDVRGNLPLHYAAASRPEHCPAGTTCGISERRSAVFDVLPEFVEGARVYNARGRLALHVAIGEGTGRCEVCNEGEEEDNDVAVADDDDCCGGDRSKTTKRARIDNGRGGARDLCHDHKGGGAATRPRRLHASGEAIAYLLERNPDALERRDGVTGLYPFMQAAAPAAMKTTESSGEGRVDRAEGPRCVDLTYLLLRRLPTLVSLGIPQGLCR